MFINLEHQARVKRMDKYFSSFHQNSAQINTTTKIYK